MHVEVKTCEPTPYGFESRLVQLSHKSELISLTIHLS